MTSVEQRIKKLEIEANRKAGKYVIYHQDPDAPGYYYMDSDRNNEPLTLGNIRARNREGKTVILVEYETTPIP